MNFLKDIEDLIQKKVAPVPKGWRTLQAICQDEGVSENTARKYLRQFVSAGTYEMQSFPVITAGKILRIPHYKRHARPAT